MQELEKQLEFPTSVTMSDKITKANRTGTGTSSKPFLFQAILLVDESWDLTLVSILSTEGHRRVESLRTAHWHAEPRRVARHDGNEGEGYNESRARGNR